MNEYFLKEIEKFNQFDELLNEIYDIQKKLIKIFKSNSDIINEIERKYSSNIGDILTILQIFSIIYIPDYDRYGELKTIFYSVGKQHKESLPYFIEEKFNGTNECSFNEFYDITLNDFVPLFVKLVIDMDRSSNYREFSELLFKRRNYYFSGLYISKKIFYKIRDTAAELYGSFQMNDIKILELDHVEGQLYEETPTRRYKQRVVTLFDTYSYSGSMPISSELCRLKAEDYIQTHKVLTVQSNPIAGYAVDPFINLSAWAKYDFITGRMIRMGQAKDKVLNSNVQITFLIISPLVMSWEREASRVIPLIFVHYYSWMLSFLKSISLTILIGNENDGFQKIDFKFDDFPLAEGIFLSLNSIQKYFMFHADNKLNLNNVKQELLMKYFFIVDVHNKSGLSYDDFEKILQSNFCIGHLRFFGNTLIYYYPGQRISKKIFNIFNSDNTIAHSSVEFLYLLFQQYLFRVYDINVLL